MQHHVPLSKKIVLSYPNLRQIRYATGRWIDRDDFINLQGKDLEKTVVRFEFPEIQHEKMGIRFVSKF